MRGIRRPVTVVTTVQRSFGSEHGEIDVRIATRAEDDLLASGLVHWTVADDPRIGSEQFLVAVNDLAEMRRACFLFTFKEKLDVRSQRYAFLFQRAERSENCHHSCFVI